MPSFSLGEMGRTTALLLQVVLIWVAWEMMPAFWPRSVPGCPPQRDMIIFLLVNFAWVAILFTLALVVRTKIDWINAAIQGVGYIGLGATRVIGATTHLHDCPPFSMVDSIRAMLIATTLGAFGLIAGLVFDYTPSGDK